MARRWQTDSQPSSECSDWPDLQLVRDFITVASSVVTSVFIIAITAARSRRVVGFFTTSEWCLAVPAYLIRSLVRGLQSSMT